MRWPGRSEHCSTIWPRGHPGRQRHHRRLTWSVGRCRWLGQDRAYGPDVTLGWVRSCPTGYRLAPAAGHPLPRHLVRAPIHLAPAGARAWMTWVPHLTVEPGRLLPVMRSPQRLEVDRIIRSAAYLRHDVVDIRWPDGHSRHPPVAATGTRGALVYERCVAAAKRTRSRAASSSLHRMPGSGPRGRTDTPRAGSRERYWATSLPSAMCRTTAMVGQRPRGP